MDQRHPLTNFDYQSGLTWDVRYETSPSISPTYLIWRRRVKFL
jgi:hypothetical protein